jgi:hypothetical protein
MRLFRALLLLGVGAAGALAADRLLSRNVEPTSQTPPIERIDPGAGDPPLVWIDGALENVGADQLLLRDGDGPTITVERFSGQATRFFRPDGDRWSELSSEDIDSIAGGEDACIEALVDGEAFLAIRVFLERACAPA